MAVRKNYLLQALLKANYFPMQKKRKEEMPPIFTSSDLTKDIAVEIINAPLSEDRKKIGGFDSVQYKTTRYNNVPRLLSIPHPKSYIDLCMGIYNNWTKIKHICTNGNSLILPKVHSDGRIIIMDYENSLEERNRYNKSVFGNKFLVHTDIANFYPSLYSHSIPWALVGIAEAKRMQFAANYWFNKIDKLIRSCCRNETAGILIGPATSNIVSEIILERIDRDLREKYNYVRFIDDYTAYFKTHTKAEKFIRDLTVELMKYKLNLNIKKTEIKDLPQAINEEWVGKIREIIPRNSVIDSSQVSNILDAAVILQRGNPDGSILKYAANSIVGKVDENSSVEFVKYVIRLCYHHPILIPTLSKPLNTVYNNELEEFKEELLFLLNDSIINMRSDAVCWLLYYLKIFHNDIPTEMGEKIIEYGDCVPLTLLAEFPTHQSEVVGFTNQLNKTDLYELDAYWLLLYQLYLKRKIRNPYKQDATFKILRTQGVSFVGLNAN
ncbi:antiviral reverse transcriptase Drt4 [Chloroflexota bacterium]